MSVGYGFTIEMYGITHSLIPLWHMPLMMRRSRIEDDARASPDVAMEDG